MNPRPPLLNALHNAFCLCAPTATHKNSLAPNHERLSSPCDRAALAQLILCPPLYPQHSPLTALAAHNIDPPDCHNWTALTHTAPFAHNWKMHLIHAFRASAHAAATSKVYLLIACACSARCLSNTLLFALCAVAAATLIALHIWPSTLCRLLYLSQTAYYQHKFRRCVRERYVCHSYGPYGIKVSAEIWPSVHRDTPLSSPQYVYVSCRRSLCVRWISIRRWSLRWLRQTANRVVAASCKAVAGNFNNDLWLVTRTFDILWVILLLYNI